MSGSPEIPGRSTTLSDVDQPDVGRRGTLGQVFDPRANALNAWRLALALGVIVWHSWVLTGRPAPPFALNQFATQAFVDGFFAISGFLIPASWLGNPRLRDYFLARGLRILPGMWVCLFVTAFVIAPIGIAFQGGRQRHAPGCEFGGRRSVGHFHLQHRHESRNDLLSG